MSEETKKCQFCGEEILTVAIKCKHCGSNLNENTVQATNASNPSIPENETLGYILLLIPVLATLLCWVWVGNMALIQDPGSSLNLIGFGTIILTAILVGYESNQLGFGKNPKNKKENGPVAFVIGTLLLWIPTYPYYLYQRSKKGKKNLVVGGLLVAIVFVLSWYFIGSAINEKINEIRGILNR